MPELADSLRKAAILLSCLEADQAGGLLARLGGNDATQLRDAVAVLGPISAAERNTVIREFLQLTSPSEHEPNGVELDEQLARRLAGQGVRMTPPRPDRFTGHTGAASPFAFLLETEAEVVAPFLAQENPQTVAVVLSFLDRQQASAILQQLDPDHRSQVVKRLARLDDVEPEAVEVVAAELRAWLERQAARKRSGPAITERSIAEISRASDPAATRQATDTRPPSPAEPPATPPAPPEPAFQDLAFLGDPQLLDVLRASPQEVLVLALADADETLLRRITQNLARREAKRLRKSINLQGPTRLADIETAKQTIARIAARVVPAEHWRNRWQP